MLNALSQAQIAALFGVAPRTVREWHEKGLPRKGNGTYDAPECVAWYVAYCTGDDLDLNREKARLAKAQADKTEMANAVQRGELVPQERAREDVGEYIDACRKRLTNVPSHVEQQLDAETARRVVPIVRERIYEAVAELRDWRPSVARQPGQPLVAAAGLNGKSVVGHVSKAAGGKRGRAGAMED
jgi:terminase small subunit / prophage DNA-packing protein